MKNKALVLAERHSGYAGNPDQWVEFLRCWYDASLASYKERLKTKPNAPYLPILNKYTLEPSKRCPVESIVISIEKAEKSLGVTLPPSYKDFLLAYQPPLLQPQDAPWGKVNIGMYAPSQIGRIADLDPFRMELVKIAPINTNNEKDFLYGIEQNGLDERIDCVPDAIFVGKYSDEIYAQLILYPQIISVDGEMEAALFGHADEFRAPSFAELMRQLSFCEINPYIAGPPFPQEVLKGTCADKILMKNVWWK